MDMLAQLAPFLIVFVVFYFLLIRPQQKRQKQHANLLNSLERGNRVVTIGGLHGTVEALTDTTVTLRVDNTKMVFERRAIASVSKEEAPAVSL